MSFHQNLKKLRKQAGLKQIDLAQALNVSQQAIAKWESGRSEPNISTLADIASVLNCTIIDLLPSKYVTHSFSNLNINDSEISYIKKYRKLDIYGRKVVDSIIDIELNRCENSTKDNLAYIPLSQLSVSAGTGEWLDGHGTDDIAIIDTPEARKADIAIRVNGDSMEPEYSDNDIVLIRLQPAVEVGEIGIFIVNGEGFIKKYTDNCLVSLNEKYDNIYPNEYTDVRCVGKVIGKAVLP